MKREPNKGKKSSEPEYLRTYKIGLRVPESILEEYNQLIREREVLQFLRKAPIKGYSMTFENFIIKKNLIDANNEIIDQYKKIFDNLKRVKNIEAELNRNKEQLKNSKNYNLALNSGHFSRADLPKFADPANPSFGEISLRDYQYLAGRGFKMLCSHLNTIALRYIDTIPSSREELVEKALEIKRAKGSGITETSIRTYPQKAIELITGTSRNIDLTAFEQMAWSLKAYYDMKKKVEVVRDLLISTDFSEVIPIILAYYSIPNHLRKYLAKAWNTDTQWVRNTIVGWRRKLDQLLPKKFQIEPLNDLFMMLANYCKRFAHDLEEVSVVSRLQKKQVLHLLPIAEIDLSPLLPSKLQAKYFDLKSRIGRCWSSDIKRKILSHTIPIDITEFENSGKLLIAEVQKNMGRFKTDSRPYKNCRAFVNKLNLILNCLHSPDIIHILQNYVVGNRFTRNVCNIFNQNVIGKKSRIIRLFSALRGIVSLTLAKKYPNAIGQIKRAFTPENCTTRPYKSKNRLRKHLPVNLIFNKFIVERKDHPSSEYFLVNRFEPSKPNATQIFRRGKPIWLGMPIYSPDQLVNGELQGKRKGLFWFQLIPGKKITECLNRGAEVRDIRLNVPKGPVNKIVADIILTSKDLNAFSHKIRFIDALDKKYQSLKIPKGEFLGSDFNRIGKYMVAVATENEEINILSMMKLFEEAHNKLEKIRKQEIARLQRCLGTGLDARGRPLSLKKADRMKAHITLLHQRRENLMKERKRQVLMVLLYVAYRTGAMHVSWDGIVGIMTRGKKGVLAKAITYMPKQKELYDIFESWAMDLKKQGYLSNYIKTEVVSPFTSQVCGECYKRTGEMRRTLKKGLPYDEFECEVCGKLSDRHSNAAHVSALLLKHQVHSSNNFTPSPLSMG